MARTSDPDGSVQPRRLSFAEEVQSVPRHFAGDGDLIASHVIAVLSALFPEGEDFFVRSVRRYRDAVTDPTLRRQVSGFIGQEAIHGREHRVLNERLDQLGYPVRRVDRLTRRGFRVRERLLPPIANLAATAALEHFTATFAEFVLAESDVRDALGGSAVRDVLVWHSLEESEHKAVAFDVYVAVGGSERLRVWTMNAFRSVFFVTLATQVLASLAVDRETYRPGRLRVSWGRFCGSMFGQREFWARIRDYNRPGFHPSDRDTEALVEEWRQRLFGADGELVDRLDRRAPAPGPAG
jgi:uncharacterized protein